MSAFGQIAQIGLTFVGYYFGGPVGAAVGSFIGQAAFGEKQKVVGPTISDLRVQQSGYGLTLPIAFGTVRSAGRVIDKSNLKPRKFTRQVGGGGLFGGGAEVEETDYYVDLAIALHDGRMGELRAITRVWADGELIYSVDDEATWDLDGAGSIADWFRRAAALLASQVGIGNCMTIYPGNYEQMPDPTLEALNGGAGTVPAYRGVGYVVIKDWLVTKWRRVPNLEFEYICDLTTEPAGARRVFGRTTNQLAYEWCGWNGFAATSPFLGPWIRSFDGSTLRVLELESPHPTFGPAEGTVTQVMRFDITGQYLGPQIAGDPYARHMAMYWGSVDSHYLWAMTDANGRACVRFNGNPDYAGGENPGVWVTPFGWAGATWENALAYDITPDDIRLLPSGPYVGRIDSTALRGVIPCVDGLHFLIVYVRDDDQARYVLRKFTREGTGDATEIVSEGDATRVKHTDTGHIECAGQCTHDMTGGYYQVGMIESDLRHVWVINHGGAGGSHLYEIDPADSVLKPVTDTSGMTAPSVPSGISRSAASIWADKGNCFTIASKGNLSFYTRMPAGTGTPPTVGEVCTALALVAGVADEEFDADDLVETCEGMVIV